MAEDEGLARTLRTGRYAPVSAPAEADITVLPSSWSRDGSLAGVVYLHGRSGSALDVDDPRHRGGVYDIVNAVGARWPLVAADLAGQGTWGHPSTQQARTADAITYLRTVVGCSDAPVALIGTSMGGLGAYLYAMNHPEQVACVVGITPVVDLDQVRRTGATFTAEVNGVWGVPNNETPLPTQADPSERTADLQAPTVMWYSSSDVIVFDETVTAFAAAVGGTAHLVGAVDHEDVANFVPPDEVVAFIDTHLETGP